MIDIKVSFYSYDEKQPENGDCILVCDDDYFCAGEYDEGAVDNGFDLYILSPRCIWTDMKDMSTMIKSSDKLI